MLELVTHSIIKSMDVSFSGKEAEELAASREMVHRLIVYYESRSQREEELNNINVAALRPLIIFLAAISDHLNGNEVA